MTVVESAHVPGLEPLLTIAGPRAGCSNSLMDLPDQLLNLLRCPLTGSRLSRLGAAGTARLNERIAAGNCDDREGKTVREPLDAALVNTAGALVVPVRRGVIVMALSELLACPADEPS